jgi:hypothetical protein
MPEKTDPPADDVDPQNRPADDVDPDDVDPDADPNADPADDDGDPEGADKLGDPGKKALATMKAKLAAARAELRKVKAATKPDDAEPTPEQAAQTKANTKILRAEIRAAAKGVLADPTDAYKFLDLSEFEVDDDGEVDRDQLDDALAELVKNKPYLAAATKGPAKRFQGGADGGPRGGQPKTLDQQITDAEKAGDWKLSRRLKLSKLAAQTKN